MLHAMMEFFSGATSPIPTNILQVRQKTYSYGTWQYPALNAIVKGERLDFMEWDTPALYLVAQESKEWRPMAQHKFINYDLECYVVWIYKQTAGGDAGPQGLWAFYGLLDSMADQIRTNKILLTPTYPTPGESVIVWGENFTIAEKHQRMENALLMSALFTIQAQEQVNA